MSEGNLPSGLAAALRGVEAAPPSSDWPHPDGLTFARARELDREPSLLTEAEVNHLARCSRCASLLSAFARNPPPPPPPNPWRQRVVFALRGISFAVLPPLINWLILRPTASTQTLAPVDWWQLTEQRLFWIVLLTVAAIALLPALFQLLGWARPGRALPLFLVGMLLTSGAWYSHAHQKKQGAQRRLETLFAAHRWIAYDPPGYDPTTGKVPSLEQIERELRQLRDEKIGGGFDGLITFSAPTGPLAEIPRLAKEVVGFKAVIMGIAINNANPERPDVQIDNAAATRDYVDGYCLGHNPTMTLDLQTLAGWMADLRKRTGKPTTTTMPLVNYLGDRGKPVRDIGDWYFPDCPGFWHLGATPGEMVRETREMLLRVTELPRDKPVLLKMISYPSGGAEGMDEDAQAEFFGAICRDLYLPPGVYLSLYSAYDLPWMDSVRRPEFSRPQQYAGLFRSDGTPKKAVEVVRKGFPIQTRP